MENGVSSNLQSPGGAVCNSSGIFYVLKDVSNYTLSMTIQSFQDFRFGNKSHLVDSISNITPNAAITYEVKHNIT